MATELRTTREVTLPPELVRRIVAFMPVDRGHVGKIVKTSVVYTDNYFGVPLAAGRYDCCGHETIGGTCRYYCSRFAKGLHHPGALVPCDALDYEVSGGYVRWTCCGARFGIHLDKTTKIPRPPPGCTPLDLTVRVTTVTRTTPVYRPISPSALGLPPPTIPVTRANVLLALEGLYAMGGRMRELACMFGTRLRWTPPHLRADDPGQTL